MRRAWAAPTVLIVALAGALLAHLLTPLSLFDDAYIILRYVNNTLQGSGAVYNPGERVFGISCPLYFVWLVVLKTALPSHDLVALAARGNALFVMVAGALAAWFARRIGLPPMGAAVSGAAVALSHTLLRASLGGMESALFMALLFGSLLALLSRRDTAALLMASLATLTRPEGAILLAGLVAILLWDPGGGRLRWRVLAGIIPLALWGLAAGGYYGTPIPHSVIAKARPLYPLPAGAALGEVLAYAGRWTLDGIRFGIGLATDGAPAVPRLLYQTLGAPMLFAPLAAELWRSASRERARRLALPLFLAGVVALYAVTNPLLLAWYLPLVHIPLILMVLQWATLPSKAMPLRIAKIAAVAGILITVAGACVFNLSGLPDSMAASGATGGMAGAQLQSYARTARWLDSRAAPEATVAAAEIGILGYHLPRRILDACGLVSPEALPHLPPPPQERGRQLGPIPTGFVKETRPDYVVFLPAFAERSLLASPWFLGAYEVVHQEPFTPDVEVLVYRRRDSGRVKE